jgi:hypothetical protein
MIIPIRQAKLDRRLGEGGWAKTNAKTKDKLVTPKRQKTKPGTRHFF